MKAKKVFENLEFKRGKDIKNALDIGEKWRIGYNHNAYQYNVEFFHGEIEDARLQAAKKLLQGKNAAIKVPKYDDSWWATFCKWKDKYKNEGQYYRTADGELKQESHWVGGWDEDFDLRVVLDRVDLEELMNDKLVEKEKE